VTSAAPIPGDGPQTAAALLDASLDRWPDHEALVSRYCRLTYAQLEHATNSASSVLRARGVVPGDRVAASIGNHADLVVAFLATMRLGAIWVGIHPRSAPPEKTYMLGLSGAKVLLGDRVTAGQFEGPGPETPELETVIDAEPSDPDSEWSALLARVVAPERPDVDVDPFAPAAVSFTSGTTGRPKAAVHSQHNIALVADGVPRLLGAPPDPGAAPIRIGVGLPLTLLNLMVVGPLTAFASGATCIAVDRVDAVGLAEWVARERIASMALVPTILHDLFTHPDVDIDALLPYFRPSAGGADCPSAWRDLFAAHGLRVAQGYGLTEALASVTLGDDDAPPGAAGRALPHLRVVIADEETGKELAAGEVGEVCVAPVTEGPWAFVYTPMLGYWRQPDESARALKDGLLHTNDIGLLDADGYLFLKDRKHDMILRGGANVYPAEVERVLAQHPAVVSSAVLGVADDRLGERVVAAVELVPGTSVTAEDLRALCQGELARHKVPETILIVESLPRTSMGKVRRREARALFEA
jgi:long-chain acyl-CoA synthetase